MLGDVLTESAFPFPLPVFPFLVLAPVWRPSDGEHRECMHVLCRKSKNKHPDRNTMCAAGAAAAIHVPVSVTQGPAAREARWMGGW